MYNNIGKKCKTVAVVVCWIGVISSIILGIFLISLNSVLYGFLYIVAGPLISWVGSLGLYGFGEIVENSIAIVEKVTILEKEIRSKEKYEIIGNNAKSIDSPVQYSQTKPDVMGKNVGIESGYNVLPDDQIECRACGKVQRSGRTVCWQCGAKFVKDDES